MQKIVARKITIFLLAILIFSGFAFSASAAIPTVTTTTAMAITDTAVTLNATINSNNETTSVWFVYGTTQSSLTLSTVPESIANSATSFSKNISGLTAGTTYYFKAMAYNQSGMGEGTVLSFMTSGNGTGSAPCAIANFTATPNQILANTTSVLSWTTTNCTSVSITNFSGGLQTSGNITTPQLAQTATYTLTATGTSGSSQTATVTITVGNTGGQNNGSIPYVPPVTPIITETPATQSPAPQVIYRTVYQNASSGNSLSVQNTLTAPIPGQYVSLLVSNRLDLFCLGDNLDQTITYKNISGTILSNTVLRIVLPKSIQFTRSSSGIFTENDNTITVMIGTFLPGQEGAVYVSGIVRNINTPTGTDLTITNATMNFTNASNSAQTSANAYGLIKTHECSRSNLVGLALFGVNFFPTSLIGILFLILIILVILLLARHFRDSRNTHPADHY